MGGLCSCLASCFAWGVQHGSLLVIEWSWVLALRLRSLGELSLIYITWSQEVSGGPVSWTWLSHLRGWGLTAGWSTKTLSATRLLVLEGLLQRWGVAVAHCRDKDTGSRSSGKYSLAWALPESTISPKKEPVASSAGSPQAKQPCIFYIYIFPPARTYPRPIESQSPMNSLGIFFFLNSRRFWW